MNIKSVIYAYHKFTNTLYVSPLNETEDWELIVLLVIMASLIMLFVLLAKFTIFHMELLFSNNTTLEYIDSKRNKTEMVKEVL